MTSRIRFEEPKIADSKEMERFESLSAAKWDWGQARGDVAISVGDYFDADKDGKKEWFYCVGGQPFESKRGHKRAGAIQCHVYRKGAVEFDHHEWNSEFYRFSERTIRDLRFGDIDRDGDIDVAFKMSDGAIYVHHNVTPRRTAPK